MKHHAATNEQVAGRQSAPTQPRSPNSRGIEDMRRSFALAVFALAAVGSQARAESAAAVVTPQAAASGLGIGQAAGYHRFGSADRLQSREPVGAVLGSRRGRWCRPSRWPAATATPSAWRYPTPRPASCSAAPRRRRTSSSGRTALPPACVPAAGAAREYRRRNGYGNAAVMPTPPAHLRDMTAGQLADAAGKLKAALSDIKDEAIRANCAAPGQRLSFDPEPAGAADAARPRAPRGGPRARARRALPLRGRHRLGHALHGAQGAVGGAVAGAVRRGCSGRRLVRGLLGHQPRDLAP